MNSTIQADRILNLSPLSARSQAGKAAGTPLCPTDSMQFTPPEAQNGTSWAKVGFLAVGAVSALAGLAGPAAAQQAPQEPQQAQTQVQDQGTAKLLESLSQSRGGGEAKYYVHIGIIGRDLEVTRDSAAEKIDSGLDVIVRTQQEVPVEAALRANEAPVRVNLNTKVDTHIHSAEQLKQFIGSQTDRVSQSEAEHVSRNLQAYEGVHGDYYYQMKELNYDDGAAPGSLRANVVLSPFEAASRLVAGAPVAFTATPVSEVVSAAQAGRSVDASKAEVRVISDQQELLSLPSSYDAAKEVWHPQMPWAHGPVEQCFNTPTAGFECTKTILRGGGRMMETPAPQAQEAPAATEVSKAPLKFYHPPLRADQMKAEHDKAQTQVHHHHRVRHHAQTQTPAEAK